MYVCTHANLSLVLEGWRRNPRSDWTGALSGHVRVSVGRLGQMGLLRARRPMSAALGIPQEAVVEAGPIGSLLAAQGRTNFCVPSGHVWEDPRIDFGVTGS